MMVAFIAMRLELLDLFSVWFFAFLVCSFVTYNLKYSFVVSVFALVNFLLAYYWFAVPPTDEYQTRQFLSNLLVTAHRGAGDDAPENTYGAFRLAIQTGADAVELDLEFTKDGVPVVLHDDTVDRTTDGSGFVNDLLWDEIDKLNASSKFKGRGRFRDFGRESIPLLEDVLKLCVDHNVRVFIDVKARARHVVPAILKMFHKYRDLYRIAAVCSFWPQVVYEIKCADSNIITGHTWRPGFFQYSDIAMKHNRYRQLWKRILSGMLDCVNEWIIHRWLWKFSGVNLVLACQNVISPRYVNWWTVRGIQTVVWTVNDHYEKLHLMYTLKCPIITDSLAGLDLKSKGSCAVGEDCDQQSTKS